MTLVSGSPKRYSTYSGIRMSAAFPTVMSLLKPRPFSRANWAKVSAMLPLWEMRAIGPGGGCQPRALTRPDALKSPAQFGPIRSEEHTSELQSRPHLVCRLLLEKKKHNSDINFPIVTNNKQSYQS